MRPRKRKAWFWSGDLGEDLLVQGQAEQPGTLSYIEFINGPHVLGFRKCNLEFVFFYRNLGSVDHRGSKKKVTTQGNNQGGRIFQQEWALLINESVHKV